jgi:hypothetical protein
MVAFGLMVTAIILSFLGLGAWPELTLLAVAMSGLTWVMSNLSPFKTKPVEGNRFTRAGAVVRTLAAFGAPLVAAVVVNIPQISYRQGATFLAALLGASSIMLALGKALDLKAALANLALCAAIAVAVNALPVPPRSSPPPKFEHDIKTDVKLKIKLQTAKGKRQESAIIGYSCFAIMPNTWFTTRPLVYLTVASTFIKAEPEVELPYSPLGYVIDAHLDSEGISKPGFSEVEVTKVFPGESRDVVVTDLRK